MVASKRILKPWRFKSTRRHIDMRHGNVLIETAIVLPVLLFVVFGLVEFGQFFYIRSSFVGAARDAARAACLHTASQADPATKASATLLQANVTLKPSWMTIVDVTRGNATVTDCSAVSAGDKLLITIQCPYNQITNAFRPLYAMTGQGIGAGKLCSGNCEMMKE